eukprot:gene13281-15343_t
MSAAWVFTLIAVVVAACAILAAYGFRGRVTTVGIDLGTTYSVVGFNDNGKVVIVPDKEGRRIFPSIVTYLDNGDILTAYEAMAQLSQQPLRTIYNAKRFIGRSLEDEQVQAYASAHSYKVVPVDGSVSNHSKVGFEIPGSATMAPRVVSPEQVGSDVLKHLLKVTADFLGHSQVNKAVIAVPAKFDANQ